MENNVNKTFCEKIYKIEKKSAIFSKIKDYTKAPKISDYGKLIQDLQDTKPKYNDAQDVYDKIIYLAQICDTLISDKKKTCQSNQALSIFEYSCYKALDKEIKNCMPYITVHENDYDLQRITGISALTTTFNKCVMSKHEKQNLEAEK